MMTNFFDTKVSEPSAESLKAAAELLKKGEVVGIPTETVYGLAANAYDIAAIRKIFLAKGRPQDNPLIVHIDQIDQMNELANEVPQIALHLAEAFWPGPLTMILPKSEQVPTETTGGLDTVAIRMPSHPTARALIRACGFPLAAPSANLSGSPSPTSADHVLHDMSGKIPMILDGGACTVGVESTVIAVYPQRVRVLRPGGVTVEMLQSIVPQVEIDDGVLQMVAQDAVVASPGMKYKHYSPKANVMILEGEFSLFSDYIARYAKEGSYALVFEGEEKLVSIPSLAYGKQEDGLSQAQGLFAALRKVDEYGATTVYTRCPHKKGVGLAVYNRLIRAAGFQVIKLGKDGNQR